MNKAMLEYLENVEFMRENNWDGRLYPEEWTHVYAFEKGQMCAEIEARVEAFAAIRRAAEVARSWDYCISDSCLCHTNAEQIRAAIRAAIGSHKT
jgi:hypothetical protein